MGDQSRPRPSRANQLPDHGKRPGWHLPVLAAVATNKESLGLQWENIEIIAKAKGIFAAALAYSNGKKDDDKNTMNIFGDAKFAETMKTLFDNQVVIF